MCIICTDSGIKGQFHSEGQYSPAIQSGPLGLTRRRLLKSGAAAAVGSLAVGSSLPAFAKAAAPNAISPEQALDRLMQGNARYVANQTKNKDFAAGRVSRAAGQYPIAIIVSCADARVTPEYLFDQPPGELFVVRVAGNFVSQSLLASIEYGVAVLGAPLIMVLGHSACGAVSAAVQSMDAKGRLPGHIQELVNAVKPAAVRVRNGDPASYLERAIKENARMQVEGLKSRPSLVQQMAQDKKIGLRSAVYDIASGKVGLV